MVEEGGLLQGGGKILQVTCRKENKIVGLDSVSVSCSYALSVVRPSVHLPVYQSSAVSP